MERDNPTGQYSAIRGFAKTQKKWYVCVHCGGETLTDYPKHCTHCSRWLEVITPEETGSVYNEKNCASVEAHRELLNPLAECVDCKNQDVLWGNSCGCKKCNPTFKCQKCRKGD